MRTKLIERSNGYLHMFPGAEKPKCGGAAVCRGAQMPVVDGVSSSHRVVVVVEKLECAYLISQGAPSS